MRKTVKTSQERTQKEKASESESQQNQVKHLPSSKTTKTVGKIQLTGARKRRHKQDKRASANDKREQE